jgi:NAD(P)-dependent dehydrogenase (short-subunit alcohol dehydrogenase family)
MGKIAVVTGASVGIGEAAAIALSSAGWNVIAFGRNPERCEAARRRIEAAAAPGSAVHFIIADLAEMREVERAASAVLEIAPAIDLLINNAGAFIDSRRTTREGLEASLAGNHLGPFLLTKRLLPRLRQAKNARIINVSSIAHTFVEDIGFDDLQLERAFDPGKAYARSKLANILFTRALADRLRGDGITVNAVHPGQVDSNFANAGGAYLRDYYARSPGLLSPEEGADTILWLATGEAGGQISGDYFSERKMIPPSAAAQDEAAAERLWQESEALIADALAKANQPAAMTSP